MATVDLRHVNKNDRVSYVDGRQTIITITDRGDGTAPVSADVNKIFDVKAGDVWSFMVIAVPTAWNSTSTDTLSIGDSAAATTFVNAQSIHATSAGLTIATTSKYYAADDAITFTWTSGGGTPTTGKVVISATCRNILNNHNYRH